MSSRVPVSASILLGLALCGEGRASTVGGSCLEAFELVNYQTKSATYASTVSSYSYFDRATVVMLLSSG
jgi:hypothetical protein